MFFNPTYKLEVWPNAKVVITVLTPPTLGRVKGSFKKIGHYCNTCNIHYNMDKKPYTVNEELHTFSNMTNNTLIISKNQNLLSNVHDYSNNYNKLYNNQQNLYGPGRIYTFNDTILRFTDQLILQDLIWILH